MNPTTTSRRIKAITHVANTDIRTLLAERERLISALESCLEMVEYYDEREGCPHVLAEIKSLLRSTKRID